MPTPIGSFLGINIENTNRGSMLPGTTGSPTQSANALVQITGLDMSVMALVAMIGAFPLVVESMREVARDILTEAQAIVPYDTGLLHDSATVYPTVVSGNTATVTFGFGENVFNPSGSAYAIPVHEIPAPPAVSVGGRSARHAGGTQWRYLLTPFLAVEDQIPDLISRKTRSKLGI